MRSIVETSGTTDLRSGPDAPTRAWLDGGTIHGGVQSKDRPSPCSFTVATVVAAMRRYADGLGIDDPWFFSRRVAERHVGRIRRDAAALEAGDLSIVATQYDVALSPLHHGLTTLAAELRRDVDLPGETRALTRDK